MAGVIVKQTPAWFIEDFESFDLSNWNGLSDVTVSTTASNIPGMMGKKCLDLNLAYYRYLQKNFSNASEIYLNFRVRPASTSCGGIFILWGSSGNPCLVITRNTSTGILSARRTSNSSAIYASTTNPIAANNTYLIQIYFKAHLTAGRLIFKINGNTEIDFTGWTCNDAACNCAQFGTNTYWQMYQYIDNFQICFTDWPWDLDIGLSKSIKATPLEVYTLPNSYPADASALPSIIRQEIPLLAHQITALNAVSPEISNLDVTKFSNPTCYFEIVAKISSGSSTVALQRQGSTDDATITVNATSLTRYRSAAFTPPASAQNYVVDVNSTAITVESARIVILQNATELLATVTHFPIGGYTSAKLNITTEILTNCVYWNYDPTQLHFGTATFYAEAVYMASSSKAAVTVVLREQDAIWSTWSDKVTIVNAGAATAFTRVRVSFTPVVGRNYSVWAYISSNKYTYSVACCKIIAIQSKPSSSVVTYGSNATPVPKFTTITNNPVSVSGWQGNPRAIDLDSNYVYMLTNYNLYRIRKQDDIPALCKTIGVSTDISAGLANDSSYVYFARSGSTVSVGEISRLWKGDWDTISTKTLTASEIYINAVCADSNYVYTVTNTAPAKVIRLLKSDWTTYDVKTLAVGEDYGSCICQDANYVYVGLMLTSGKVVRVAKSDWSTTTTKTFTATEGLVGKICVDDNYVFVGCYANAGVANQEKTSLVRLNKSDFSTTVIYRPSPYTTDIGGVVVDDTYVYFNCRDRTIWLPAFRVSYRLEKNSDFTTAKVYYMYGTQYGDTGVLTYDYYDQNHFWYAPNSPPYSGTVIRYDKYGWCDEQISTNVLGYSEIGITGLACDTTDTYAYYTYYTTGSPYTIRKILLSNATSAATLAFPAGVTPSTTTTFQNCQIIGDYYYFPAIVGGVSRVQLNPTLSFGGTIDISSYIASGSNTNLCYDSNRNFLFFTSADPASGTPNDCPPRLVRIDLSSFTYHSHLDLTPGFPNAGSTYSRSRPCIDNVRGYYYIAASFSSGTTILSTIWKVDLATFQQAGLTFVSGFYVYNLNVDESTGDLYTFENPTVETSGVRATPVMRRIDPNTFQVTGTSRMSLPFGQGHIWIDPTKKRGYTICRTVTDTDQAGMNDYPIFAYDLTTMSYLGRVDRYVNPAYMEGSYMYYIVGPWCMNAAKNSFYHILNDDSYYTYAKWCSLVGLDGGESIELIYTRSDYQMVSHNVDPAATGLRETYALWDPYEYGTEGAWAYSFQHYLIQPPFKAAGGYLQNKSTGTEISNTRVFGGGPTGIIDDLQQFQVYNGSYTDRAIYGGSGTNEFIVQSFRTGSTPFYLSCASFEIKKTGTPADNLRCDLYNDTYPSGLLAAAVTISGSLIDSAAYYPFGFKFLNPVYVGSTYFLKIYRTGARDTSNYYQIQSTSTAPPDNLYAAFVSGSGSLGSAQGPSAFTVSSTPSSPAALPAATTISLDLYVTDGGAGIQVSGVQVKNKQKRKFKLESGSTIQTSTSNSVALSLLKSLLATLSIYSSTSLIDLTIEGTGAKELVTLISVLASTPTANLNVLREVQLNVPTNSSTVSPNLNVQRSVSSSSSISSYTQVAALKVLREIALAIDSAAKTSNISVDVLRYVTASLIVSTITDEIDVNLQRILTASIGAQTLTSSVDLLIKLFFTMSTIVESSSSTYNLNVVRSLNTAILSSSFTDEPLTTIFRTISQLVELATKSSTTNLNVLRDVMMTSPVTTSTDEILLNVLLSLLSVIVTNTEVSGVKLDILRSTLATISNTSLTNTVLLNVLRDVQVDIDNSTVTSAPLLGLIHEIIATIDSTTSTSIPTLGLLYGVLTSIISASSTDVLLLNVLRETQVNINSTTLTSAPLLNLLYSVLLTINNTTTVGIPPLNILRETLTTINNSTLSDSVLLNILHNIQVDISNVTSTSIPLLNLLRELLSLINNTTSTRVPLLGLLHNVLTEIDNLSLTSTTLLDVLRETQVNINGVSLTSIPLINILRDVLSAISNDTSTSTSFLDILRETLVAINNVTLTGISSLDVVRKTSTTIDNVTSTDVPLLNILHQLETLLSSSTLTDPPTLDILRQVESPLQIVTSTTVIDISFFKQLMSTISSQVLITAINLNVLRSVQSDISLLSTTDNSLLAVQRSLSNSIGIVTSTFDAMLALTKILITGIDLETITSEAFIDLAGAIKYLNSLISLASSTPEIRADILRDVSSSSIITTSSTESLLSILKTLVSSFDFSTTTTNIELPVLRSLTAEIANLSITDTISIEILRRLQALFNVSTTTSNTLLGLAFKFSSQINANSATPDISLNVQRLLNLASSLQTLSSEPFLERLASLGSDINIPIEVQEVALDILRGVETQINLQSNTPEINIIIGGILQLLTLMSLQSTTSDVNLEFIRTRGIKLFVKLIQRLRQP